MPGEAAKPEAAASPSQAIRLLALFVTAASIALGVVYGLTYAAATRAMLQLFPPPAAWMGQSLADRLGLPAGHSQTEPVSVRIVPLPQNGMYQSGSGTVKVRKALLPQAGGSSPGAEAVDQRGGKADKHGSQHR